MRAFIQQLSYSMVAGSALIHVFCCGLPLLMSTSSLFATVGIFGAEFSHAPWFEALEIKLLIASGMMLFVSLLIHVVSQRINCVKDGACAHEPCESKKDTSKLLLCVAFGLYALNVALFISSHGA